MFSVSDCWERVEKDVRDMEHHLEDLVRMTRGQERLKYEDWIDQLREIRRHAHQKAEGIAINPLDPVEASPHLTEGLHAEEPHLGALHQDYSHPINWAKHAWWFEAEGTKPKLKYEPLDVVSQDIARADIADTLCNELREAGFTPYLRTMLPRKRRCSLYRLEEKICFIERTKPYYLSKQTERWAEEYLRLLKTRERETRPRIPFTCPQ